MNWLTRTAPTRSANTPRRSNPNTRVIIEGHTDSVRGDDYNQALSQRRAEAVADALRLRGVPPDRYEAKGLGKSFPVASNDTPAGREQSRRVEIVFSDASGRFAQGGRRAPVRDELSVASA